MEKDELIRRIGINIKILRKKQGISQAELGWRCYKDKQAMEKIENGKVNPTIYTLYLIAQALGVGLEVIVKTKEEN